MGETWRAFGRQGVATALALAASFAALDADAATIYSFKDENGVLHISNRKLTDRFRTLYVFPDKADKKAEQGGAGAPGAAMAVMPAGPVPDREEILRIIRDVCPTLGLEPGLVRAMVEVESGYCVTAVSPKGAQGLMQIMPATQRDLGLASPFDAKRNIEAGSRYMRQLLDKFDHSLHLALAAYNAGPALVERHGGIPPIPETINYVLEVLDRYQRYRVAFR